ncbi:MAG: DNA polymerase II large subunit, partial [Candidatus Bathyarchaeota archaeon]
TELMYMEDVIAGRPIFAFPSRAGGFRLRYGRSRNTGLAALGIHPATMTILNNFLASGTQIRVEGPVKGGIVVPVDTIEPPIVKLKNGSVVKVESVAEAEKLKNNIEQILFLGDLLVAFGEFLENNKPLAESGYVEEWWIQELKSALQKSYGGSLDIATKVSGFSLKRLKELIENPLQVKPTAQEALTLAEKFKVPLHPRFIYFWKDITFEELTILRQAFTKAEKKIDDDTYTIELPSNEKVKDILERLAVPHESSGKKILISQDALILDECLKTDMPEVKIKKQKTIIETIEALSGILLREKAPTYIGARMGRPEKARKRDMSPPVHALFPVGLAGGLRRDVAMAAKRGVLKMEVARRKCPECSKITYKLTCPNCGSQTVVERVCSRCGRVIDSDMCPICKVYTVGFDERDVDLGEIYKNACSVTGLQSVELIKGVRGLTSAEKIPEPLEKGILRAKHRLSVYKDGTIRFDATNAPLTHFKPEEINVSVEKLKLLGYSHDIYGAPIQNLSQICELRVQDVIIPKTCADYLLQVTQFIDELSEKVYKIPKYYTAKQKEDLLGHIIVGFAPHTSAGIIGRIIGFTGANVCYAHPLWHNIKRRDCDGDEDSVMLALDVLLNFSKCYLPAQIGGMMDAPLLLISTIDPFEVDETRNMDVAFSYPSSFYFKTLEHADPKAISDIIDIVGHRLGNSAQFEGYGYTHQTYSINEGNLDSAYMKLGAMSNKLSSQLQLAEIIRAVDPKEVAKKVLTTHLIRDIVGNLTAFTKQRMRCKKCNAKYRRIPLSGKCPRCGGELVLTVHRKGIEKYLEIADELVHKYDLGYYQQRIALIRDELSLLFKETTPEKPKEKQIELGEFM